MNELPPSHFLASTPDGLLEFSLHAAADTVIQQNLTPGTGGFLCPSPDGSRIFACHDGPADADGFTGTVRSFRRPRPFQALEPVPGPQSSRGVTACHLALHPLGTFVAVANFRGPGGRETQGSVAVLPVAPDGTLGPAVSRLAFPGQGAKLPRQSASHPHSVAFTSSPSRLRVADLGTDGYWAVPLDPKGKTGEPVRQALPPGSGPRHQAVSDNGHALFVNTEMSNELFWFQPQDGFAESDPSSLRQAARAGLLPEGATGASAADLHATPDDRFVYASVRGPDLIAGFRVDRENEKLIPIGHTPSGGSGPRSFCISLDGTLLIVSHTGTGGLKAFRRDLESGALEALDIGLPAGGHVVAVPG